MESNYHKKIYKKKQILLTHSISLRGNNYPYSIDNQGVVTEHYNPEYYSDYLKHKNDRHIIVINLLNEGWLDLNPLTGKYQTWIGKDYKKPKSEVLFKEWRNQRYWGSYPMEQVVSTVDLCKSLCEKFKIPLETIGHNTKIDGISKYKGICCHSNYSELHTALNPSYPFKYFKNEIEG